MTAADLIHAIEQACDEAGLDESSVEVRLAHQPTWPFEYSIDEGPDITVVEVQNDAYERHDKVVYLPEGLQLGYLPEVASKALGWR